MSTSKQVTILLVEDDDLDRRSLRRAFAKEKIANPIIEANNGVHALEILRGTDNQAPLEQPYLVLLDLNMPVMSGHEFLDVLRADEQLKEAIVFVLTTSSDQEDKSRAYNNSVAGYLLKKTVGDDFLKTIKMLDSFMLSVEFPDS